MESNPPAGFRGGVRRGRVLHTVSLEGEVSGYTDGASCLCVTGCRHVEAVPLEVQHENPGG